MEHRWVALWNLTKTGQQCGMEHGLGSTVECNMDWVALEWNMDWVAVLNGTWMGSTVESNKDWVAL